jgi:hypothetical protein
MALGRVDRKSQEEKLDKLKDISKEKNYLRIFGEYNVDSLQLIRYIWTQSEESIINFNSFKDQMKRIIGWSKSKWKERQLFDLLSVNSLSVDLLMTKTKDKCLIT